MKKNSRRDSRSRSSSSSEGGTKSKRSNSTTTTTTKEAKNLPQHAKSSLYKTELCRQFAISGSCSYGTRCQFAHGEEDLRRRSARHPKYKTQKCKAYWNQGFCPYGGRCMFLHDEPDNENSTESLVTQVAAMNICPKVIEGTKTMTRANSGSGDEAKGSGRSGSMCSQSSRFSRRDSRASSFSEIFEGVTPRSDSVDLYENSPWISEAPAAKSSPHLTPSAEKSNEGSRLPFFARLCSEDDDAAKASKAPKK